MFDSPLKSIVRLESIINVVMIEVLCQRECYAHRYIKCTLYANCL